MINYLLDKENETEFIKEEADIIVMQVSEDIILDHMIDQIEKSVIPSEVTEMKQNFFPYFELRFKFMMDRYEEGSEARNACIDAYDVILDTLLDKINDVHGISIEFPSVTSIERKEEYVKELYTFLVCNIKENLINYLYHTVMNNKDFLLEMIMSDDSNVNNLRSLSYQNLRKYIDNEYTPLIYNINKIALIDVDITNEEFLESCIRNDEEEITNYAVSRLLIEQSIADIDFKESFTAIYSNTIEYNSEIHREVKIRLIESLK